MSEHTSGPWHISKHFWWQIQGKEDGRIGSNVIAEVSRTNIGRANARLIAAVPDLLEACKKARQFIENGVENGYIHLPDKPDSALDTLPQICTAIAKAGG